MSLRCSYSLLLKECKSKQKKKTKFLAFKNKASGLFQVSLMSEYANFQACSLAISNSYIYAFRFLFPPHGHWHNHLTHSLMTWNLFRVKTEHRFGKSIQMSVIVNHGIKFYSCLYSTKCKVTPLALMELQWIDARVNESRHFVMCQD